MIPLTEIKDNDSLREAVRGRMDCRRYAHTLAVEEEIAALARLYIPKEEERLRTAALLHDITKCETTEKQLQYCAEFDIIMDDFDISSPALLHAKTGAAVAVRDFPRVADSFVADVIRWHTTGREGMTVPQMLLYLADVTERTRQYEECLEIRRFFWDALPERMSEEERFFHLCRAVLRCCDMTLSHLEKRGESADPDTKRCRDYVSRLLCDTYADGGRSKKGEQ